MRVQRTAGLRGIRSKPIIQSITSKVPRNDLAGKKKQRKDRNSRNPAITHEETETKPLEIGDLLESEALKSEESILHSFSPWLIQVRYFGVDTFLSSTSLS